MSFALPALLARPMTQLWLNTSPSSWRRQVIAADSPRVHSSGMNADRILIVGAGIASGRGVVTHDLSLPGHLARSLSARTGNAADVDIVVDQDMTIQTCPAALSNLDLLRYDVIVLSIGHNETLALMRPAEWEAGLRTLLRSFQDRVAAATKVFILPVPVFRPRSPLPAPLARVVDDRAHALNLVTFRLTAAVSNVTLMWDIDAVTFQPETTHLYQLWADELSARISQELEQDRTPAGEAGQTDEDGRVRALQDLEQARTGIDPVLDSLTESVRHAFGTRFAAITLVHSDIQTMAAISGMDPIVLPRSEAFCDVTIRRSRHLVIEDTSADTRYAQYSIVTGTPHIRSYAGYPIESPDGYRIGAVCVMDTRPRRFTHNDIALLRTLAHLVQERLWQRTGKRRTL